MLISKGRPIGLPLLALSQRPSYRFSYRLNLVQCTVHSPVRRVKYGFLDFGRDDA